jgi:hypothetical protein
MVIGASNSAYVFEQVGSAWTELAQLVANNATPGELFGASVAVFEDTDTIVVGAPTHYGGIYSSSDVGGSAYVFVQVSGPLRWTEQARLSLYPNSSYSFGNTVAISGDSIAATAIHDFEDEELRGAVYVFRRAAGSWSEQERLFPRDDEWFRGVAFSEDSLFVSGDAVAGSSRKRFIDVFMQTGDIWTVHAKLLPSKLDGDLYFPSSSSLAVAADRLVACAYRKAYIIVRSGSSWTEQSKVMCNRHANPDGFCSDLAIMGDTLVVGGNEGTYIFTFADEVWTEQAILRPNDNAGSSVAISSEHSVIIGSPYDDDDDGSGVPSGSVFVYDIN